MLGRRENTLTHKKLLESILETLGESADTLDWEVYDGCLYMIRQYLGVGDMCPDADIETELNPADEEELTRLISGEVWQKE